jgi:hypothetical protein
MDVVCENVVSVVPRWVLLMKEILEVERENRMYGDNLEKMKEEEDLLLLFGK